MGKHERVRLSAAERERVEAVIESEESSVRERKRAQVLHMSDLGWSVQEVVDGSGASRSTVGRVRRWYREGGVEWAIYEPQRPGRPSRFGTADEQRIVALACTEPPCGHSRWTVRLLAEEAIRRKVVSSIGRERVRLILRDHELKPWREKNVVHSDT